MHTVAIWRFSFLCGWLVGTGAWQRMGEGWRHNDVAKRLLEVALCASGRLGVVAYPGKPPTVIDEVFGHFIATVNPLVSESSGVLEWIYLFFLCRVGTALRSFCSRRRCLPWPLPSHAPLLTLFDGLFTIDMLGCGCVQYATMQQVGAGGLDANVPTGTVIGLFEEPDDEGCIVDYGIDDANIQVHHTSSLDASGFLLAGAVRTRRSRSSPSMAHW